MSDPASAAAISALSEAIRDLTVALAPASADLQTASQGEWELLGEEVEDHKVRKDIDCLSVRQRPVEEGPGPTPQYCLDLAVRKLTGKPPGPTVRCRRAFVAGFFAKKAVVIGWFCGALPLHLLCTSPLVWILADRLKEELRIQCSRLLHPLLRWRFSALVQGFQSLRQEYGEVSSQVLPRWGSQPHHLEATFGIEKGRQPACHYGHTTAGSKWWLFDRSSRALFG